MSGIYKRLIDNETAVFLSHARKYILDDDSDDEDKNMMNVLLMVLCEADLWYDDEMKSGEEIFEILSKIIGKMMDDFYHNWDPSLFCATNLSINNLIQLIQKKFPDLVCPIADMGPILLKACKNFLQSDQIGKLILEEYKIFKENPEISFAERTAKICTQRYIDFIDSKREPRYKHDVLIWTILDIIFRECEMADLMKTENESSRVLSKTIYDFLQNNYDRYYDLAENREILKDLYNLMKSKYPNYDISEDNFQLQFFMSLNFFINRDNHKDFVIAFAKSRVVDKCSQDEINYDYQVQEIIELTSKKS